MKHIIALLLENAVRHARTEVLVSVTAHEDGVEVRVRDDGPGLAAGDEERVFERFVSLDGRGGSRGVELTSTPLARTTSRPALRGGPG